MKKGFTSFFLLASFILIILSANSSGRASSSDEGNTGAPGDARNGASAKTCQFCHSSGAFSPLTLKIELYDSLGTTKLTTYVPNKVHTIRTTLTAAGTPTGYGFQMIDIKKTTNTPVAGFLPQSSQPSNVQIATTSAQSPTPNRTYAEHRDVSELPVFNVKWRAPVSGAGAVTFYAAGNAVNRNGGSNGDGSTSTNQEFAEGTTTTKEATENVRFDVLNDQNTEGSLLSLTSDKARTVTLRVCNLAGQIVHSDTWNVVSGNNVKTLNLGAVRGAHLIQVIDNQMIITKKIIKL